MNRKLKILLVFIGICVLYTLFNYHPVISAYFDDDKYVENETFTPANGTYDFRKISFNDTNSKSYRTIIDTSGFAQMVNDGENYTINVLEWNKMTRARCDRINSSLMLELKKPKHVIDNITIYEGDFLTDKFYSAYAYDKNTNTAIYIATPTADETVEMMKTLKFK